MPLQLLGENVRDDRNDLVEPQRERGASQLRGLGFDEAVNELSPDFQAANELMCLVWPQVLEPALATSNPASLRNVLARVSVLRERGRTTRNRTARVVLRKLDHWVRALTEVEPLDTALLDKIHKRMFAEYLRSVVSDERRLANKEESYEDLQEVIDGVRIEGIGGRSTSWPGGGARGTT